MAPTPPFILQAPSESTRQEAERILRTTARAWTLDYPVRSRSRNSFLKTHWPATPLAGVGSRASGAGVLAVRV